MSKKPKTKLVVIAGCGDVGDMNWGDWASTVDAETHKRWCEALQPYIGKKVYVAGGGGRGISEAILTDVEMVEHLNSDYYPCSSGPKLKAHLKDVRSLTGNGPFSGGPMRDFDPIIGSWQILVEVPA